MRWLLFWPLLLLAAAPAASRDLKVCADPNNLPFSNAKREGFENRLVERIAADLHRRVHYVWWPQRRGNVRQTLNAGLCDIIPGVGSNLEMLATTRPYYRSSYMFVTRSDRNLRLSGLDDPQLKLLKIGVQMVGDDGSNTPPAHALARRGIVNNVRGYMIYGDYAQPDPQSRIVGAVGGGEIDVAIIWGPVAGYFSRRSRVPLDIRPVTPWLDGPSLPMAFEVSMGVRKNNVAERRLLDEWLKENATFVRSLISEFGVPAL